MSKEQVYSREEILSFLSQDATAMLQESNDSMARSIISFVEHNIVFENNSAKVDSYFDLYPKDAEGREIVLNLVRCWSKFGVHSESIIDFLDGKTYQNALLKEILNNDFFEEVLLVPFVLKMFDKASINPGRYSELKPYISEFIRNSEMFQEKVFAILDGDDSAKKTYIKYCFCFEPLGGYPSLISEDIVGLNPIINNILKKIKTDIDDSKKPELVEEFIAKLGKLIEHPSIALILECASNHANLYLYKKKEGGLCSDGDLYLTLSYGVNVAITCLVHEATHFYMDYAYKNDCNPFHEEDEESKQLYANLAKEIVDKIKEDPFLCPDFKYELAMDGFNEFSLKRHLEENLAAELPAHFMQEIAIRILNPDPDMRPSIVLSYDDKIMQMIDGASAEIRHKSEEVVLAEDVIAHDLLDVADLVESIVVDPVETIGQTESEYHG